jgi:hypothetical protein
MARNIDIATAYNNWWDARKKEVNQYDKGWLWKDSQKRWKLASMEEGPM